MTAIVGWRQAAAQLPQRDVSIDSKFSCASSQVEFDLVELGMKPREPNGSRPDQVRSVALAQHNELDEKELSFPKQIRYASAG